MSRQFKLHVQAVLVGMLLTLAVLLSVAGVAWSTSFGIESGVEAISSPQVGPGDGGG